MTVLATVLRLLLLLLVVVMLLLAGLTRFWVLVAGGVAPGPLELQHGLLLLLLLLLQLILEDIYLSAWQHL